MYDDARISKLLFYSNQPEILLRGLPAPTHIGELVLVWELGVPVPFLQNEQGLIRIPLSYDQGLFRVVHSRIHVGEVWTGFQKHSHWALLLSKNVILMGYMKTPSSSHPET
jgi:hypothetical protein